jgi:hypothetical protein
MPQQMTSLILWASLALAQLLYVVLPIPVQENDPDFLSSLALAMGVVAFAEAIGALVLLRSRALGPISAGTLDPQSRQGVAGLFTTLIICWVLAESIAVYGLVLRIMGAESDLWSPFAVVGGLLLLVCRPWQHGLKPPRPAGPRKITSRPPDH